MLKKVSSAGLGFLICQTRTVSCHYDIWKPVRSFNLPMDEVGGLVHLSIDCNATSFLVAYHISRNDMLPRPCRRRRI